MAPHIGAGSCNVAFVLQRNWDTGRAAGWDWRGGRRGGEEGEGSENDGDGLHFWIGFIVERKWGGSERLVDWLRTLWSGAERFDREYESSLYTIERLSLPSYYFRSRNSSVYRVSAFTLSVAQSQAMKTNAPKPMY